MDPVQSRMIPPHLDVKVTKLDDVDEHSIFVGLQVHHEFHSGQFADAKQLLSTQTFRHELRFPLRVGGGVYAHIIHKKLMESNKQYIALRDASSRLRIQASNIASYRADSKPLLWITTLSELSMKLDSQAEELRVLHDCLVAARWGFEGVFDGDIDTCLEECVSTTYRIYEKMMLSLIDRIPWRD
ncbi:MAG: hypothetical protein Q9168_007141 [Polycauliona sp. 1 TL-2023]